VVVEEEGHEFVERVNVEENAEEILVRLEGDGIVSDGKEEIVVAEVVVLVGIEKV